MSGSMEHLMSSQDAWLFSTTAFGLFAGVSYALERRVFGWVKVAFICSTTLLMAAPSESIETLDSKGRTRFAEGVRGDPQLEAYGRGAMADGRLTYEEYDGLTSLWYQRYAEKRKHAEQHGTVEAERELKRLQQPAAAGR
jgi:hypothetical protein